MTSRGISSGRYTRYNIIKAIRATTTAKGSVYVLVAFTILMGLSILGQASTTGPTIPLEQHSGFYQFYINGSYSFVVFSYNSNGTPQTGQNVKLVLTNSTTEKAETLNGTIASDGLAVLNFTNNESWNAELYTFVQGSYQANVGYGVSPSAIPVEPFVSYLVIFDQGHLNKAGFVMFYVDPERGFAPYTSYRIAYSTSPPKYLENSDPYAISSNSTNRSGYNGVIGLGNLGGFRYTTISVNYAGVPANLTDLYGGLQFYNGSNWKYVPNLFNNGGSMPLLLKPTQRYVDPQAYNLFLGINLLFMALFAVFITIIVFGYPRANRSIELLLSKPLTRFDILSAKYLGVISLLAISSIIDISLFNLLIGYNLGIYLSLYSSTIIFATTILVGTVFSSFTFLFNTLLRGMILVLVAPIFLLLFFYYAYAPLIDGFTSLLGTVKIYVPNATVNLLGILGPFQLSSTIQSDLLRKLGYFTVIGAEPIPFSFLLPLLLVWCIVPFTIAAAAWRRIDA